MHCRFNQLNHLAVRVTDGRSGAPRLAPQGPPGEASPRSLKQRWNLSEMLADQTASAAAAHASTVSTVQPPGTPAATQRVGRP